MSVRNRFEAILGYEMKVNLLPEGERRTNSLGESLLNLSALLGKLNFQMNVALVVDMRVERRPSQSETFQYAWKSLHSTRNATNKKICFQWCTDLNIKFTNKYLFHKDESYQNKQLNII